MSFPIPAPARLLSLVLIFAPVGAPTLEMSRRLETLAKKLDAQVVTTDVLQALRGIETLDMIASPAALQVLDELSKGAPGHRITEEARRSLDRVGRQAGS